MADVIETKDGARLVGTVAGINDGKITLKTSYAGDIEVAQSEVAKLTMESALAIRLEDGTTVEGIASNVRSGENRGKKLEHEFLVLGWSQQPIRSGKAPLPLPEKDATVNAPRQAIAVWISRADDPTPLQATGGWLD